MKALCLHPRYNRAIVFSWALNIPLNFQSDHSNCWLFLFSDNQRIVFQFISSLVSWGDSVSWTHARRSCAHWVYRVLKRFLGGEETVLHPTAGTEKLSIDSRPLGDACQVDVPRRTAQKRTGTTHIKEGSFLVSRAYWENIIPRLKELHWFDFYTILSFFWVTLKWSQIS